MADNLGYTPGSGASIATDELSDSSHAQIIKLAYSADGTRTFIGADANGLDVDVTRVGGNVTVIQSTASSLKVDPSDVTSPVSDAGGSLTVDAPATTPVFVRLSSGSAAVDTIPVGDGGSTLSVDDGGGALTVDGTVAATQSGTWNVGTLTTITNAVAVTDNSGTLTVDDGGTSLTVDGTVTTTQGNAGTIGQSWFTKVGDGTNAATITNVGSDYGLDVNVISQTGGAVFADSAVFTEGTSNVGAIGGVYNPTRVASVSDNDISVVRVTAKGDLQVNLVDSSGAEVGTAGAPLRIDPTGDTNQGVDITMIAGNAVDDAANGIMKVGLTDEAGAAFTAANPLYVEQSTSGAVVAANNPTFVQPVMAAAVVSETNPLHALRSLIGKTPVRKLVAPGASETAQTIWTPAAGKKWVLEYLIVSASTGGVITIFDNTDTSANTVFKGTLTTGAPSIVPCGGHPSSTADNVLKYTTGTFVGTVVAVGYETA